MRDLIGKSVEFVGLKSRPQLNGEFGIIDRFHADRQKFEVRIVAQDGASVESVLVGRSNLLLTGTTPRSTKACSTCGASESDVGHALKCCALCVEEHLASPAKYCSRECQVADWREHKRWHAVNAENRELSQTQNVGALCMSDMNSINTHFATVMASSQDRYVRLCGESSLACTSGDYKKAKKIAERAILSNASHPRGHYILGEALRWSSNSAAAGEAYLECMRLSAPGTPVPTDTEPEEHHRVWAMSTVFAVDCIIQPDNAVSKEGWPAWMKERVQFQRAADRILEALPSHVLAWRMRGMAYRPEVKIGTNHPLKKDVRVAIEAYRRLSEIEFDEQTRKYAQMTADFFSRKFPDCWE
jgi:hypothetical protein